jgi:hypothetical protein
MAVGQYKGVRFGEDTFGGKLYGVRDYSGPTSYVTGGDAVDPHAFGFPNTITYLDGTIDQTNTYTATGRPLHSDVTAWQLVWTVNSTGLEVAAGTNLSQYTVRLLAFGV